MCRVDLFVSSETSLLFGPNEIFWADSRPGGVRSSYSLTSRLRNAYFELEWLYGGCFPVADSDLLDADIHSIDVGSVPRPFRLFACLFCMYSQLTFSIYSSSLPTPLNGLYKHFL